MKSDQPIENDKSLRQVLGAWRVDAALPSRFQEQVWDRIESREQLASGTWMTVWQWLTALSTRPAFAGACLAIFLAVGVSAGYESGQSKTAHIKFDLQARYIQMIDPYKTPR